MVALGPERDSTEDIVDAIAESALAAFELLMREHGAVAPPTVHIFVEEFPSFYVGFAATRAFYRGEDAASAIARLGLLPASMVADRVLVCWENEDLYAALKGPGSYQNAVMILDARLDGTQTLRWHPFTSQWGPDSELGFPTVLPRWSSPHRTKGQALPAPIRAILHTWRFEAGNHEFGTTVDRLQHEGYRINFRTLDG
ncbi:hypothetical protein [Actinomycetospora callitridis]|uniref:hypothetical protein n=1 Tax=Actinomycetospora callitridis TaxID=913944 RepID=UPI002366F7E3|nr:hypothetical protein [Actinomycetospora callitridis]MDD7920146.1 hypothetical protein [Actinomycetospora callitridis]